MKRLLLYPENYTRHPKDSRMDTHIDYAVQRIDGLMYGTKDNYDIGIYWKFGNVWEPDEWAKDNNLLNVNCSNVTKKRVDEIFTEAFGYSSLVTSGECIAKRNQNSRHEGIITTAPWDNGQLDKYDDDYRVSQKIINNVSGVWAVDYRVYRFKDHLFVAEFKKYAFYQRFRSTAKRTTFYHIDEVFSQAEVNNILYFCDLAGLDFGELDVLRDDDKIYIIDMGRISAGILPFKNKQVSDAYIKGVKYLLYET